MDSYRIEFSQSAERDIRKISSTLIESILAKVEVLRVNFSVKRAELLKHLGKQGCVLYREGKRHTLYVNLRDVLISAILRHR